MNTPLIYVSDTGDMRLVFVCASALKNHLVCLESEIVLLFSVVVSWELLWPTTMTKMKSNGKDPAGCLVMRALLHCRGRKDNPWQAVDRIEASVAHYKTC